MLGAAIFQRVLWRVEGGTSEVGKIVTEEIPLGMRSCSVAE